MRGNDVRRNILVVDDEPQITRVLRTTLASHGYNVRTGGGRRRGSRSDAGMGA